MRGILHVGHEFQGCNRVKRHRTIYIPGTDVTMLIYKRRSALRMKFLSAVLNIYTFMDIYF